MVCGSVRLTNVRVTHPQRNQRGDPDSCRSRFEGSVVAPVVPSNGAGWSHLLLTSVETSERDTYHKNHLLQKCYTKFAHLVRGPRCGFIQTSPRVMKHRHSARIAVRLHVQSSALQRRQECFQPSRMKSERQLLPSVLSNKLTSMTPRAARNDTSKTSPRWQAQAAAATISRETLCA